METIGRFGFKLGSLATHGTFYRDVSGRTACLRTRFTFAPRRLWVLFAAGALNLSLKPYTIPLQTHSAKTQTML